MSNMREQEKLEKAEPTVYVIQDPGSKNLENARKFGTLEVILTGKEDPARGTRLLTNIMMGVRPIDYLLLLGSPLFIGVAMHAGLLALNGKLNVLVWDKQHLEYVKHEVN